MPLRDHKLTLLPRFSVMRRKPSHLVSKTHCFVVEGFVDERREHRSISGVHAFLSAWQIVQQCLRLQLLAHYVHAHDFQ